MGHGYLFGGKNMKLKNMTKEELEILSYTDLTALILKEEGKSLSTPSIFHIICDLLGYTEEEYTNKIGDFYTSLTIDKRFVFLDNNEWDLREKHAVAIVIDDDDLDEEIDEEMVEEEEEEEENIDTVLEDEDLDDDDDLDDLAVLDDEELDEEN